MRLDATHHDDLSDINKTAPLSLRDLKRIVRAAREAGELAMDYPKPTMPLYYTGERFGSPHKIVDAFLGGEGAWACPCHNETRVFLDQLTRMHFAVFAYRANAPQEIYTRDLVAQFDAMLID